jgi:pimeloyl-ACP methyl ester carboxylesterase
VASDTSAHYYQSSDGLNLFYRDVGGQHEGSPIICLPGLTRNSRDFEDLAPYLGTRRRVLSVDFRGRGFSDRDPHWQNYHPGSYVADVWTLLDRLDVPKVIVIGTSLGGLCAMLMAAQRAERIAGVVMNDIGPDIDPAGLARIQNYTGRLPPVANWAEAAAQAKEIYGQWLPGLSDAQFERLARRGYREDDIGVPKLDVDPNVGRAVREVGPQKGDPRALFGALANIPTTLLWGMMSDVLSADIVARMRHAKPDLAVVPVANRGHVPLLDEPECLVAFDEFLQRVP